MDSIQSFAQLTAIQETIRRYYEEPPFAFLPSQDDFQEWLSTLLEEDQIFFLEKGMMHCGNMHAFRRFYFEKYGHRMEAFLQFHLSDEDYRVWLAL